MTLNEQQADRLADLATASRDAQELAAVARGRLQGAVLQAVDEFGASHREVAQAIGVTHSRVYQIVIASYARQ